MYFDTIEAAPLMTNCYLIGDEKAKACAVVDPGGSPEKVIAMIERSNMEIKMILLTHGHYDHIGAVDALLEKWPGLPVYIHPADLCPAESTRERYRMPDKGASQRTYGDGDVLELGELRIHVLHTPGHSPGSVVLLVEDVMRSALGNFDQIFGTSLEEQLYGAAEGEGTASEAVSSPSPSPQPEESVADASSDIG